MKPEFQLVRYFSITSLITIALAAVVLGVLYREVARRDVLEMAERDNLMNARSLARHIWSDIAPLIRSLEGFEGEALRGHHAVAEIRNYITQGLDKHFGGLTGAIKIKVLDRRGLTVFSTDDRDIGNPASRAGGVAAALAGEVSSKLVYKDALSFFEKRYEHVDVIESYIPIRPGGPETPVEVVFELYNDVTPVIRRVERSQWMVAAGVVTTLFAVFGMLTLIVVRADRIIKRAERQLRQVQKVESLGTLAGGIAHQLNNLLLPITALTRMTLKNLPDDSPERTKLEKVAEASDRAKELVAQVRAFSRMEEPEQENIEILEVVRKTMKLLRTTLPSTIKVTERLDENAGVVFADAEQIELVLVNLASNAADAMERDTGEMKVSLSRVDVDEALAKSVHGLEAGAYAKLTVNDTGCGMDDAALERIFDPFFTTKEVGKGTGLGLSMLHGTVTRHGGAIDVSSELGKGTTFEVYLPLVE